MKLADSIVATLRYSDHFSHPLNPDELHSRLIEYHASLLTLKHSLSRLVNNRKIAKTRGYYHLPGRSSIVSRRDRHAKLAEPLIARAKILTRRLTYFPGILAIYLTGSLAVGSGDKDSDIDLMIITHSGRLWITRFLLTLYTSLLGLRRTPRSTDNSGRLCLNLYLTPESFKLPPDKQSLYSAYELIQAVPLYDPHNTRYHLLIANPWVKKYLPNFSSEAKTQPLANGWANPILDLVENVVYRLQLAYMRPRITNEYITKDAAFFHPNNPHLVK